MQRLEKAGDAPSASCNGHSLPDLPLNRKCIREPVVPLKPGKEWPDIKAFCGALARNMAEAEPDRFTANLSKARRKGRLFIDYLRNERGSTAICPWSVRSRENAPVAVPVNWDEVPRLKQANGFSLAAAAERAQDQSMWADYFEQRQTLTVRMLDNVGAERAT